MRHTVEVPCRIYAMVKTHEAFKRTAEQLSVHNKSGRRRGLKFQINLYNKIRTSVCRELVRDLMRRATNSTIVVLFCDSQRTVHTLTVERRLGSVIAFFVGRTRTSTTKAFYQALLRSHSCEKTSPAFHALYKSIMLAS